MTEQTGTELVAGDPTPRAQAHMMAISERSGLVAYSTMADVIEAAKLMSQAGLAVRKHFRGNPGACMAVIQQSLRWGMDAYAVANRSYHVNDQLAYESSVFQSVILLNAPIKGRLKHEFRGEGADRHCRVWAELRDEPGVIVEYTSPRFADIKPKNSPLWQSDPDQQHYYSSARSFCRRHFPEILLGALDRDEAEVIDGEYREVPTESMNAKLDRIAAPKKERQPRAAASAPAGQPGPDLTSKPSGYTEAFALAELVIEDGIITKSRDGNALQGGATEEDESKAQLILEGGKIVKNVTKKADPRATMPDIPADLDRRPKADPVKVTSGKVEPEKVPDAPRDEAADERATQQEIASAAGAFDPANDPFADRDDPEPEAPKHPVDVAVEAFKIAAPKAKSEADFEVLRKALLKEVKGMAQDDPYYVKAGTTYQAEYKAFQVRIGKAAPPAASPTPAPSAATTTASAEDEDELERILTSELDHAPRGIDTGSLGQVKAYVKGMEAAAKGRAAGAVPAVYSDEESEAWKIGHAYRTANPKTEG